MYDLIIGIAIILLLIINLVVLFFVSAFLVRIRDEQKEFISDIVDVLENFGTLKKTATTSNRGKSWDQKFEEELDEVQRRSRDDRGLV